MVSTSTGGLLGRMRVRDVTDNALDDDDVEEDDDDDNMNGGAGGQEVGFRLKRDCRSMKSHRRFAFVQPPQAGWTSSHFCVWSVLSLLMYTVGRHGRW